MVFYFILFYVFHSPVESIHIFNKKPIIFFLQIKKLIQIGFHYLVEFGVKVQEVKKEKILNDHNSFHRNIFVNFNSCNSSQEKNKIKINCIINLLYFYCFHNPLKKILHFQILDFEDLILLQWKIFPTFFEHSLLILPILLCKFQFFGSREKKKKLKVNLHIVVVFLKKYFGYYINFVFFC